MKSSRSKLYLLFAIFFLPMILAFLLFHYHAYFNFKTSNKGVLINPPINIQESYTHWPNGKEKLWRVFYIDSGFCDNQCFAISHQLHQMLKLLGKDQKRVSMMSIGGNANFDDWQTKFNHAGLNNFIVQNKIYLIDPLGNLFMYYPSSEQPMNIYKDLKHVLEVSQIG